MEARPFKLQLCDGHIKISHVQVLFGEVIISRPKWDKYWIFLHCQASICGRRIEFNYDFVASNQIGATEEDKVKTILDAMLALAYKETMEDFKRGESLAN